MELDTRKLYLGEGYSSLFIYCTQVLYLSEHAAYRRIEAAQLARRFPVVLTRLADGDLTLTAIGLLATHLTPENYLELLDAVRHKSKRAVEQLVAQMNPQPDAPSVVRKLPAPRASDTPSRPIAPAAMTQNPHAAPLLHGSCAESSVESREGGLELPAATSRGVFAVSNRPADVKPLAPERYKMQFTISRETYEQLRHAQDLLRHSIPNGDPAAIFEKALVLLVKQLERTKHAAATRPRPAAACSPTSRHIPASVKREVWQRDGGQCAFMGAHGRCAERGFLEFHHVVPYADGGEATVENLVLRCRAHNAYEAGQFFGAERLPGTRGEHAACDA